MLTSTPLSMPWCLNRLSLTGPAPARRRFRSQVRGRTTWFADTPASERARATRLPLCLHALVPIPAEVRAEPFYPLGYDWVTRH